MAVVQRKITFRLYPNAAQSASLEEVFALHCRVYNTLLEEHRLRYETAESRFGFSDMCKALTGWRKTTDALKKLNAQSLQVTAKRLALAFDAFFRRVRAGETPGFPRFKSHQRFSGWGYKTYGDGWSLHQNTGAHGQVRLSGIGLVPMRGKGRFAGSPKTAEVIRDGAKWYLSVTYNVDECAVARPKGTEVAAFDWGLSTLLTLAKPDGSMEEIDNPRWLRCKLGAIKLLQSALSAEETRIRSAKGLPAEAVLHPSQFSCKLRRLRAQLRAIHGKVARQRHDFYHKLTSQMVSRFAFLGTEELEPGKMSRAPKPKENPDEPGIFLPNGAARKAGLNRSILDAAPSKLLGMLRTKAVEAASVFAEAKTREVKPTQRCHACGALIRKTLSDRLHVCACGACCGRDENASKTLLRWLIEGDFWSGTGQEARMSPPLETPSIPA